MSKTNKKELHGVLTGLGIPYTVDFTNADPDAHNYAIKKLTEKFGLKGRCTLLDYALFYGERLTSEETQKEAGSTELVVSEIQKEKEA